MNWETERKGLLDAGFQESEVEEYARQNRKEMFDAGFSQSEIDDYYGVKKPDMSGVKAFFEENLKKFRDTDFQKEATEVGDEFVRALDAGWQMSVSGLVARGQAPDVVLEDDAPFFAQIAKEAGVLAGDLPAMLAGGFMGRIAGGIAGGAAGSAIPGVGNAAGAVAGQFIGQGAGSNMLPTAMREILMDKYTKGEIKDFRDFWSRASGVFLDTMKSGVVGGVTSGVGGSVARVVGKAGAPALARTASQMTSEVATMVTVGKALEGEVPSAKDFLHAGAVVAGMHLTGKVVGKGADHTAGKLRTIYAKTGLKPEQVVEMAETDPVLRQEIAADNIDVPESLKPVEEPVQINPELAEAPAKTFAEEVAPLDAAIDQLQREALRTPEARARYEELVSQRDEVINRHTALDSGDFPRMLEKTLGGVIPRLESVPPVETTTSKGTKIVLSAGAREIPMESGVTGRQLMMTFPTVIAKDANGNVVGELSIKPEMREDGTTKYVSAGVDVPEPMRRQGIASKLYAYANGLVAKLEPSDYRTDLGDKFGPSVDFENLDAQSREFFPERPKAEAPAPKIAFDTPDMKEASAILEVVPETRVEVEPLPKPETPPKTPDGDGPSGGGPDDPAAKVLERIVPGDKKKTPLTFDQAYTNAVDDLHPLKRFVQMLTGEKPIAVKDDPYSLARLTRGAYGKADQFLESAPFDFNTLENLDVKPLKKILEPFKDNLDGLRAYLVSRRSLELFDRGIETGVPVDAAREVVRTTAKKYHKAFEEIQGYQNAVLKYAKDSGIISEADYQAILSQNQAYIPFHRMVDEAGSAGKGLNVRNPIKAIKGSEKQIIDPVETMIKNTYTLITLAERNRVGVKMKELAEGAGESGKLLMEKVPTPMKPIDISAKEAGQGLESAGANPDMIKDIFDEAGIDPKEDGFTIFRPNRQPLAKDEIAVFSEGKREVYKVAPEVAESIKALDQQSTNLLVKILSAPARALRAGAVLSPDFIVRNVIRDQFTAFTLSGNGYIPIADALVGLGSLFKKDDAFQGWLKAGGANSAAVSIDRDYINQKIFKLNKETGFIDATMNVVRSPLEMLRVATEVMENSTRLGEFKRAQKKGKDPFAAAMDAREVTLDFARVGAKTRAMNMITAFWNAQIQGMDRMVRAFQDRPLETLTKMTASITIPSILLWWANKDDERMREIPRWQKDLFWIIPTDKHIYRIPKPFEMGLVFGSLPERTLENFFTDNPRAFKDFSETMMEAAAPSMLPTFAIPGIEHFANKSTFTGAPLIPRDLEGLLPEYQYTEYTTETAKALGKMIGSLPGAKDTSISSPAIVENYIRAWSGGLGMYALQIADKGLEVAGVTPEKVRAEKTLAEIPVIKAFVVRYPGSNAQSIRDFYERYNDNQKYINTVKHLAKSGDFDAVQNELRVEENSHRMVQLSDTREALANGTKMIKLINANPQIPPAEKRQLIDATYLRMIEAAKYGNKMFDEMEKAMKGKKQ